MVWEGLWWSGDGLGRSVVVWRWSRKVWGGLAGSGDGLEKSVVVWRWAREVCDGLGRSVMIWKSLLWNSGILDYGSALTPPPPRGIQQDQYHYRDVITFYCNFGYVMQGASALECTATGEWNGTVPTCECEWNGSWELEWNGACECE